MPSTVTPVSDPDLRAREPFHSGFGARYAMSIRDGAAYLGLPASVLIAARREGRIPAKQVGRRILILRRDLEAFADALPDTADTERAGEPIMSVSTMWQYAWLSRGQGQVTFFMATGVKRFVLPFQEAVQELCSQRWELVTVIRAGEDESWYFKRPEASP